MPYSYSNIRYHLPALIMLLLCLAANTHAQENFKAILINQVDSTAVAYASVGVAETGFNGMTNGKGEFACRIPDSTKQLTITVSAIGFKSTITYRLAHTVPERVYVELLADALKEVTVVGATLPAAEVVKRAVAAIPQNYKSENYYAFSYYRQYQYVNHQYINLIEAQPIVRFVVGNTGAGLAANETFAVDEMRRTTVRGTPISLYESFIQRHMLENPVYHLEQSSLDPSRLGYYKYVFDSATNEKDYVVNYLSSHYSSEHHGIDQYERFNFDGESWETGKLVIDRKTFAIKHYERKANRHPHYSYPNENNIVQPEMEYTFEFANADLVVDFVFFEGKWYLKRLLHQYTNEFYRTFSFSRDFVVSDVFEWYSNAIMDRKEKGFSAKFHPKLPKKTGRYDPDQWKDINFPSYFHNKEEMYKDLGRMGPLDMQFNRASAN